MVAHIVIALTKCVETQCNEQPNSFVMFVWVTDTFCVKSTLLFLVGRLVVHIGLPCI